MITNPGELKKVAKLQRLDPTAKSKNGMPVKDSWKDIKSFRCKIETEESKSIRSAFKDGVVANLDYKIVTARYFEDVRHGDRLIINGKPFDIEIINNVGEENVELRLWVKGARI